MPDAQEDFRENTYTENKELFTSHYNFSVDNEKQLQGFYLKIASISATIGAFSFLILDSAASRSLLVLGDMGLLATIVFWNF